MAPNRLPFLPRPLFRRSWAVSLLALSALANPALAGWDWHETVSPHFVVKHESAWTPPGFVLTIEKMHNRLRMDLAMFSPWMAKERLNLYLYKERASFLAGEFKPPQWSNGLAIYGKKTVIVHDQEDREKLQEIIAHETTHLLFEGYWAEEKKEPPTWLNEGLAMLEEGASAGKPERSPWYQTMAFWNDGLLTLESFFATQPTKHMRGGEQDDKAVARWYVQAYSLVFFLYRHHSRLQFKNFCARLRDGEPLEDALWKVYRYRKVEQLEAVWLKWFRDPIHQRRVKIAFHAQEKQKERKSLATPIETDGFESLRK